MDNKERFVRVGGKVINLDLVSDLEIIRDEVQVCMIAPGLGGKPRYLIFEGEEAKVLSNWIQRNSTDLVQQAKQTNSVVGAFGGS